jgi:hypothetical protein
MKGWGGESFSCGYIYVIMMQLLVEKVKFSKDIDKLAHIFKNVTISPARRV